MTRVRSTTATGGRKLTPEHRAKLSATNKAKFAAMPAAEQEAIRARLALGRGKKPPAPPPARSDPPPTAGGRVNPLAMTPREMLRSFRDRTPSGDPAGDQ